MLLVVAVRLEEVCTMRSDLSVATAWCSMKLFGREEGLEGLGRVWNLGDQADFFFFFFFGGGVVIFGELGGSNLELHCGLFGGIEKF